MAADARTAAASGSRVGILAPEEDLLALAPRLAAVASSGRIVTARLGSRTASHVAARDLFAALRALDATGVDLIFASAPEEGELSEALIDRLTRAAEGRVITT
jgi:L-threonylcarbamoyladenylate synthase